MQLTFALTDNIVGCDNLDLSVRLSVLLRDACELQFTDRCSIGVHVRCVTCIGAAAHMHGLSEMCMCVAAHSFRTDKICTCT